MTTTLYWQTEGQGDDLVLIHGWGMNGAVWQHLLPQLTPHYRVHVVDLPGYGLSSDADAGNLDEVVQLLLENSPPTATWIGWSLGA
ncbi:biotin synthesis protein bioH [Photobacterium aphoticum]|uniref:Biotin synthesis protein bioH n=1 Tax=Photobacterium aphoticum TaxID=754436 RepID=A0A090RDS1_9GAMM|nr:biotin synthesis protein bioH [Photobacterium aphoticum]